MVSYTSKIKQLVTLNIVVLGILLAVPANVLSDDMTPIPADPAGLGAWFDANVKPIADRKGTIDPVLDEAEAGEVKVIKVNLDGSAEFKTITDAVKSIPTGNTKRVIISIAPGSYKEKIEIENTKPFVTFLGDPNGGTNLTFDGTNAKNKGTLYSGTLTVASDYFVGVNLNIINSSPMPTIKIKGGQAVAMRIWGDKAAFYNCKFYGFQDTLCDDQGQHFFKDCYIQGTVDFIFGRGKSLYLNTELNVVTTEGMRVITAQNRNGEEETGYSFVHCKITGGGNGTYLGRAWMPAPRVIFAFTDMGPVVNPLGWSNNFQPKREKTVYFGEYKTTGEGATVDKRVKFGKQLSDSEVQPFIALRYIEGSKWLLPAPKL